MVADAANHRLRVSAAMLTTATVAGSTVTDVALRFRKRIRIAPGVRINITGKGITSATIGPRGASVNVGKRGTYLNTGIPGTGLYARERISGPSKRSVAPPPPEEKQSSGKKAVWIAILFIIAILAIAAQ